MDEVLKAVKGVANWRRLGKELIGERRAPLALQRHASIPESQPRGYTNLDRIRDTYKSDEARLRAVVEIFLGEDRSVFKNHRSWRRVIWALYCANEFDKAQQIRSYAERLKSMLECGVPTSTGIIPYKR